MPWYEVRALTVELAALRRINFSIVEQRQQALERLGNLESEAPYAESKRFPEGKRFICEAWGDWARKFQQLKLALSFKEQQGGDGRRGNQSDGSEVFASYENSRVAFFNATTAMYDQLMRRDGVWTRRDFEDRFTFDWGAAAP